MVAAPTRRGIRFTAVLLTALLAAPAFTPGAQAQALINIRIDPGAVSIHVDGFAPPTNFVEENETVRVRAIVRNTGVSNGVDIPIFFWVPWTSKADCARINVPGGSQAIAYWNFTATQDMDNTSHTVTVLTNLRPEAKDLQYYPGLTFPSYCNESTYDPRTEITGSTEKRAWGYFIKGHRLDLTVTDVDWCRGPNVDPCSTDMAAGGSYFNVTRYPGDAGENRTYFRIRVQNYGTWQDMTNRSSGSCAANASGQPEGCPQFLFTTQVRVTGPGITTPEQLSTISDTIVGNVTWRRSADWSLENRKGNYTVRVTVDPLGHLRQSSQANDQLIRNDIQVRWVELRPEIETSDFKTDPSDPYPFTNQIRITGAIRFFNDGLADAARPSTPVSVRWYIDSPTHSYFSKTQTLASLPADSNVTLYVDWNGTDTFNHERYLSRGAHTLFAQIDAPGSYSEPNEANNLVSIPIYVQDPSAPTFPPNAPNPPNPKLTETGAANSPEKTRIHPHEAFHVQATIQDDDTNLTVRAEFTLKANTNITRNYTLSRVPADTTGRWFVGISNFPWIGHDANATREDWELRVNATDPSGNTGLSAARDLRVDPWPIQTLPANDIIVTPPDNHTISWASNEHPFFRIRVLSNWTGVALQERTATNMNLTVDPPGTGVDGQPYTINLIPQEDCSSPDVVDLLDPTCEYPGIFTTSFSKSDPGSPGRWNVTIRVRDSANIVRSINRTFYVLDEKPKFDLFELTSSVAAGANLTLASGVTDDINVRAAYLNFTRVGDGAYRNITLATTGSAPQADGNVTHYFNATLPTGRGTTLGLAGTFNVTLVAVDNSDNWARSALKTVTISDANRPNVLAAGADPAVQEVGANVTFYAIATDETNITVHLLLMRGNEVMMTEILTPTGVGNNHTFTTAFDREGTYTWRIFARDSNPTPLESDPRVGPVGIRDNLGPRFELRSPSAVIDGTRYGSAMPRIEVLVFDSDGVDPETIVMEVGGIPVTPDVAPASGGVNGYTLTYAVPASARFPHNETVDIHLGATDLSERRLDGSRAFSFRVDDSAPTSRASHFEPRHRATDGHIWNVSAETAFTLTAEDDDGLPTGVESIRYQIIGGGNSQAETVYSGPFRITDAPGVYTGPRVYQVQFWAEDAVGNRERPSQSLTIYVDDTPPALDPYGSLPQGRYVNATFVDDRSEVDRAVVWYRINNETWRSLALTYEAGAWRGIIPEGRKGDRVSYYLQAWDGVQNADAFGSQEEPYSSYTVGNHLPSIRITAPVDGGRVNRNLDLRWTATDEDGDALRYGVHYRAPGRTNFVELATITDGRTQHYEIDTTRFVDGQYTLRVTANDGSFVALSEVTVLFLNRGSPVGAVPQLPERILPGESFLIKAEITKAQADVRARVYRDGKLFAEYPMNDEGRDGDEVASDGMYSVRVSFDGAGTYSIEIFTRYEEDGQLKESSVTDAASFTVRMTPAYILGNFAALWVAIAALAAAAAGIGVYTLRRRRN